MTILISPDSNQLFSSAVVSTAATSFGFRSDRTRNNFNALATWLKGRLGSGTFVLQTLKPGLVLTTEAAEETDTDADWTTTTDTINIPDEFRTEYIAGFQRYRLSGVAAAGAVVAATQNSGVEVDFEITAHGLVVGDKIVTLGFTPAAYNGTFTVKAVPTVNLITVDLLSDPGGNATVVGTSALTVIEALLRKDNN